ncbi:DEAD/DEAH box helicase family protein [Streptomyces sp. MW-W600-10]|uniref:DEAD/DEAH box helicase family protein n=1 Tax=Streptomyces sp. MW-W600-10 TaxID=2829819 RepID=UPI00210EC799|nr:DEAD/DEAH box helicase family protein [Streptomyces sp. MW-W600-10]
MNVQQMPMPQANGSWITLRPHQAEAVDAIVRGLSLPAGGTMPVGGLRGQVHMATGTGKTITAARAARKLCPAGVIGVLVPTLDLLTQTIEAWRRVGHNGPAVAVCSLGADPLLEALGVRCTTNPTQLALWASSGPMLVFATYASLASQGLADEEDDAPDATAPGVLEQALRGSYGQTMAPFDLVVVDEAHRTSGNAAKAWACVHDQDRIPAARRLYMTATPRLWEAAPPNDGRRGGRRRPARLGRGGRHPAERRGSARRAAGRLDGRHRPVRARSPRDRPDGGRGARDFGAVRGGCAGDPRPLTHRGGRLAGGAAGPPGSQPSRPRSSSTPTSPAPAAT